MPDLNEVVEKIGRTWEEYKKTNDERMKQLESKGVVDPLITEKLAKLDAVISENQKIKQDIEDLAKKASRPSAKGSEHDTDRAEHSAQFVKFMRKGDESGLRALEMKAMVGNSDPDGGYLVTHETDTAISRILGDEVAMRRLATVRPIGGASLSMPVNVGGANGGWAGETESPSETNTPTFRELTFEAHKMYAEPRVTQDMLEDAYLNVEQWLADEISTTLTELEADAFINGNGIKKPRGLLSYTNVADTSYAWGSIGYTPSGHATAFASSSPSDALIALIHTLKRGYRNGASWLMNDLTLAAIRKFKDGQGNYLWQPGLQEGIASTLLGYGVEIDDNMPDLGADAFPIAFANFSQAYVIVDRRGTALLRDPYTAKPYVKFYTTRRVGGGVKNFEAVKLMKIATS